MVILKWEGTCLLATIKTRNLKIKIDPTVNAVYHLDWSFLNQVATAAHPRARSLGYFECVLCVISSKVFILMMYSKIQL